jgi:MoaA/NifB/PqqE/SkfB family radical SAM enzyme
MDLPDNEAFCIFPWVHLAGSVDGVWGRCCVDRAMNHDGLYSNDSEPEFVLKPDALGCLPQARYAPANPDRALGLIEAFNSPNMRRTRLAMLAGQRVDACSYCYEREAGGGESYRQKAPQIIGADVDVPALVALTDANGSVPAFPPYLDLRFGNACNLKCIMCSYPVSSRWGLDQHPTWAPAHIDPYRYDEQLWAVLREHAHELRRIYFAGGEPFLQQGHMRLLDLLIEVGAAPSIHLAYHSNMMTLPAGIFDRLSHFRSVEIGASCDGVGPIFEKIRTGGRWDLFVRNVRTAKQHVDVWLSVAPQRDNVLHLAEIIDFAVAEGLRTDLTNFVHWPKHLAVCNLPDPDKAAAITYLISLAAGCRDRGLDDEAAQLKMLIDFVRSLDPPNEAEPGPR